jgi:putative Holliday junction resolvase
MNSPYLGLDLGFKRTGVALSESGMIAHPLGVIEAKPPHMTNVVQEILEIVRQHEVATLVIGVPYTQDEALTSQALRIEQVISQIEQALPAIVEVIRVNEFHSSLDAAELYPKIDKDSAAAAIILQDYLDSLANA